MIPTSYERGFTLLKEAGLLQKIRPQDLSKIIMRNVGPLQHVNLLTLSCCDGHQFCDVTAHATGCFTEAKQMLGIELIGDDCIHWRSENGGPFVLSVPRLEIRLYRGEPDNVRRNIFASMHESMGLKKLDVVLLLAHCVCGKVAELFDSPVEYVRYLALAKENVMREFNLPSSQVIAWLQTHRRDGRRTYHLDYSGVRATDLLGFRDEILRSA